jgi:Arc/MetJ-type ribon-helix-helix transcriptional regulator
MKSYIVSIRIPKELVKELRSVSERDHFMDQSEAVRSIVRSKWLSAIDPTSLKIEQLKRDILNGISKTNQEALVAQLERIKDEIIRGKNE